MVKFDDILLVTYVAVFLIQMMYIWLVFARVAYYKPMSKPASKLPVSVVIVAPNDSHDLIDSLKLILNQDYPEYEVVVVHDNSDEDARFFLKELSKSHPHLKVVQIDQSLNFFSGKKFSLSIGIKSASYDTLLLTDAHCMVSSKRWIAEMQQAFQDKTQIVLGYGSYKPEPGFLNRLIRFDTYMEAMHYLSFALLKNPYMGIGRNLAYSKRMFYQKNGFISHYKISSGDDNLFINQAANKLNTSICIAPDSFTYAVPEKKMGSWLKYKKQALSTNGLYKTKHRIFLILYPLSLFLFYVFGILLLSLNSWLIAVLILFVIRLVSFLLVHKSALQKLKEQKLLLFSPILELLLYASHTLVVTLNIFKGGNKWR